MANRVAQDRYGIGYSGLAYLDAEVKLLALGKTKAGPFVPPSYEAVARAEYPLSRLIFLNLNRAPGKPLPPALSEFLRFIVSREGQQLVRDQGLYMPLRAAQAADSRALFEK